VGKAPAFQFYVRDWLSDPQLRMTSHITKGIWIDMLCFMWEAPERGKIRGSKEELMQLISATDGNLKHFLEQAQKLKFADVTICNNEVTICNRRMLREQKERENTRLRVKRHRQKQESNNNVTVPSSSSSSTSSSTSIAKNKEYTSDFEEFWKIYPNHASGKQKAFESWETAFQKNPNLEVKTIMESVENHKKNSWEWNRGAIAHATTWLNQGRWTAEFEEVDDDF